MGYKANPGRSSSLIVFEVGERRSTSVTHSVHSLFDRALFWPLCLKHCMIRKHNVFFLPLIKIALFFENCYSICSDNTESHFKPGIHFTHDSHFTWWFLIILNYFNWLERVNAKITTIVAFPFSLMLKS